MNSPADSEDEEIDGTGAFWELVQKSAEKEKLLEMILGGKAAMGGINFASQRAAGERINGDGGQSHSCGKIPVEPTASSTASGSPSEVGPAPQALLL